MARIPGEEIERLKREISLEELVAAKGVELRRVGSDLHGRCPFHEDRTPSLIISPEKRLWHCLGACQAGGTVIDWVMKAEGVSFRAAYELLREGMPTVAPFSEKKTGRQTGLVPKKSTVAKLPPLASPDMDDAALLGQVVHYYHETLKQSPEALAYLEKRGLKSAEAVERFRLGYANRTLGYRLPERNRVAGAALRGQLDRLGVLRENGREHLNGSLVIPLFDGNGRVVQLYGRKIGSDLRPETPLHLYLPGPHQGVWNVEAFEHSKEIIVCEALIDALTFWCAGFRNVTASYGINGFTPAHREALTRYGTERVYIAYDRDEAGEEAAGRLGAELVGLGIEVYRVLFPKGMDANEYALLVKPAEKSLGMALRQATWVGGVRRRSESRELGDEAEELSRTAASVEASDGAARRGVPRDGAMSEELAAPDIEESGGAADGDGAGEHAQGSERSGLGGSDGACGAAGADADGGDARVLEAAGRGAATRGDDGDERTSGARVPASAEPGVKAGAVKSTAFAAVKREVGIASEEPEAMGARAIPSASSPTSLLAATVALKDVAAGVQVGAPRSREEVMSQADHGPQTTDHEADEVRFCFGPRRWRARGLSKNALPGILKLNLFVSIEGGGFHVDQLDLYAARQRGVYTKQAAAELGVEEEVVKRDLGKVLLKLEQLQDEQIREAQSPKSIAVTMSEADKKAALELLRDPRLLDRILEDFERCGVVGEHTNKLVGYLAATSRKLTDPLAVIIQSSSAAGKSSLMDAVLELMPKEERVQYSAMTGQSLYYMGETDLQHKILAIAEEQGGERAAYALKLLQSAGELTIASTGKDPATGRLVTQEYHVEGPVMLFQTTTAVDMDEELLNRCIVLTVDEGREQTKAIHERQRQARTLEGVMARQERQRLLALHQNAQRLIRPLFVVNPYASELRFPDHQTRTRRDHTKYLGLIEAVTLLHQYQREEKTAKDGLRYIEVTREDIDVANRLAHEVLGRSLDELPPQTRRLLGLLDEMATAEAGKLGLERRDFRFSRREVRERTGWGDTQLKVHLGRLVDMEYLMVHRGGGHSQRFGYELVYECPATDGPFVPGLISAGELGKAYDRNRSGQNEEGSGSGRPSVGLWSAGGRGNEASERELKTSAKRENGASSMPKARCGNGHSGPVVASAAVVASGLS